MSDDEIQVEYDDLLDIVEYGEIPVATVIAVEDHEGRVLYSGVRFTQHPYKGDVNGDAESHGMTPERLAGAIAAYVCVLGHKACQ